MGVNICIAPQQQMCMLSCCEYWVTAVEKNISWSSLNPLRLPSCCWVCRGTPPVTVLFLSGPLNPPLPLPPDSWCVSSPVCEVPKVLWGNYAVCLPYANLSCKAELFWCCVNSRLGADSLCSTTLCFGLSQMGYNNTPWFLKIMPNTRLFILCYSCQPWRQCTWIPAVLSFLLDLHNNYWLCH